MCGLGPPVLCRSELPVATERLPAVNVALPNRPGLCHGMPILMCGTHDGDMSSTLCI